MTLTQSSQTAFMRSPSGRFVTTGSGFIWCSSPTLCGVCLWGAPDAAETRTIMRVFSEYPRAMAPTFHAILDTRAVEVVDGEALGVLTSWMWKHRGDLVERVKVSSVIRPNATGYLLTGLLPTIANNNAFSVTTEPAPAFIKILGDEGLALAAEVEQLATGLRGVPPALQAIRALLVTRLDLSKTEAAKCLGLSPRSLQRVLSSCGTSFQHEVVSARFEKGRDLLMTTSLKVGAVAARLTISERALTLMFRSKTGLTPTEWRAQRPK